MQAPFEVFEAPGGDSPVVVEVPHAGLLLDPESASWIIAPARSIARDADLYVDELFANAAERGATFIVARMSRYVVDLNRAPADYDGAAVAGGPPHERPRGVIWRLSSDGLPVLRDAVSTEELERRMARFYQPYHATLAAIIERKRRRFGLAVLLCAHSMPTPRGHNRGALASVADIVPGTRGRTTAGGTWIGVVEEAAKEAGWAVQHDVPYRGGYTTGHYGRPSEGVHAVQLEIARRLYMDERTLARTEASRDGAGFPRVERFAEDLVSRLVERARAAEGIADGRRAGVS